MELNQIMEFSHKLYREIEESGMDTYEAVVCADILKNSLMFNNFAITLEKIRNEGTQN